ncbi:GAF domain-containing sensor histidine kinase [Desertivirga brevis]|uniref:GAF domain-containing sensor histidine kinase n=1 Tax=Desertivirga brevis TaxID=2810310 RepID=UPI001A96BF43|nr:GAF domain-containing sensor histidine kinase [Pedobacter sp. SYSU D00873]
MSFANGSGYPENEMQRIIALSELDLDYGDLDETFKDLTILATAITGTNHSVVNLIDHYSQWTVSTNNKEISVCPREESVCQFVVATGEDIEVRDLSSTDKIKDLDFVKQNPDLKYYYGIPLKTKEGYSLGAFCVLDQETKTLTEEQISLLKIIANEVVKRLESIQTIAELKRKVAAMQQNTKRVAHDIRGPVGGIIGLSEAIVSDDEMPAEEIREMVGLIMDSGNTLLDLTNEILKQRDEPVAATNQVELKSKLETLFNVQAKNKNIHFQVQSNLANANIYFTNNGLLQIVGNLISNSLKFTPTGGYVKVELDLFPNELSTNLRISVIDSGIGIEAERIRMIMNGDVRSTKGTTGEGGFGLGLNAVRALIANQNGELEISSQVGVGTKVTVTLPVDLK